MATLSDLFASPTTCALLDYLLAHPNAVYSRWMLCDALHRDRRAVDSALKRLAAAGLLVVDARFPTGPVARLAASPLVDALLAFHRALTQAQYVAAKSQ